MKKRIRKRIFAFFMAVMMVLEILSPIGNGIFNLGAKEVYAEMMGGYEYEVLDDGTVGITGHYGTLDPTADYGYANNITIPKEIEGMSVTEIKTGTFRDQFRLKSVEIPSSIRSIGSKAFQYCSSLESIEIESPSSLIKIEERAFEGCDSLKSIEIPSGVTLIGQYAFKGCDNLKSVEIPSGVKFIGLGAFESCSSLESIEVPSGITYIEMGTFYNCSSLESIEISSTVTSIGASAFSNCSSLKSIEIPNR